MPSNSSLPPDDADRTPEDVITRAPRKRHTVLVVIPGWPSQDPNRPMIWTWKPSAMKAAKEMKRMRAAMPHLIWDVEPMSATQARAIKLRPFNLREYNARVFVGK